MLLLLLPLPPIHYSSFYFSHTCSSSCSSLSSSFFLFSFFSSFAITTTTPLLCLHFHLLLLFLQFLLFPLLPLRHFLLLPLPLFLMLLLLVLQSEYVAPADERRRYISGFSGSAGTAVVTAKHQALWTDGRYFLQADQQLDCTWLLMKQKNPGVSRRGRRRREIRG